MNRSFPDLSVCRQIGREIMSLMTVKENLYVNILDR